MIESPGRTTLVRSTIGAIMADDKTLDLILRQARSHGDFTDRAVPEEALRAAHELMKWGPTSANSQPMRVLYLRSKEAREKLRPALGPTNLEKTMKAPLVALVAYDRSEEHTSELQSRLHLVCRLLLEKKNKKNTSTSYTH